jgi:ABC-type amino acid transport substrate-binding protein
LATLLTLLPCFAANEEKSFKTLNDFSGARFSTLNGTVADKLTQSVIPNSDNFVYYYTVADGIMALKSNKVDAFVLDDPICRLAAARNPEVMVFHEPVMPDQYGFAFPKGSPLRDKFNTVIRKFQEDGTLQNLRDIWLGADDSKKVLIKQDWAGKNGTIRYFHDYIVEPIVYIGPDGPLGYEIDLAMRIAKELDMKIKLTKGCICDNFEIDGKSISEMDDKLLLNLLARMAHTIAFHWRERELEDWRKTELIDILQQMTENFYDKQSFSSEPCECCGDYIETSTLEI